MKITTTRAVLFYLAAAIATVAVWFALRSFARLPDGVHHKFVAGIFVPFVIGVVALCDWIEKKRKAHSGSSISPRKFGWPDIVLLSVCAVAGFAVTYFKAR
jgi:hypothetical protein